MMAVWFYTSRPWKARIWLNIPLTVWLILGLCANIAFFWLTPYLSKFIGLTDVGFASWIIFTLTIGFVALGGIWAEIVRLLGLNQS